MKKIIIISTLILSILSFTINCVDPVRILSEKEFLETLRISIHILDRWNNVKNILETIQNCKDDGVNSGTFIHNDQLIGKFVCKENKVTTYSPYNGVQKVTLDIGNFENLITQEKLVRSHWESIKRK